MTELLLKQIKYPIFEANQVLTNGHLNDLRDYLVRVDRETHIEGIGTGILGGMEVLVRRNAAGGLVAIDLGCGAGITSEGILAHVDKCSLTLARDYTDLADYAPFWTGTVEAGNRAQIPIIELLSETAPENVAAETAKFKALDLAQFVLLLYIECDQRDLRGCSLEDCNEHGQEVLINVRKLLFPRASIGPNQVRPAYPAINRAAAVQPLRMLRALDFTDGATLRQAFKRASADMIDALSAALPATWTTYADLVSDTAPPVLDFRARVEADAGAAWPGALKTYLTKGFAAMDDNRVQVFYDFMRDLVSAHNAFIACAAQARMADCPDRAAFPRHLLLGELETLSHTALSVHRHYYHGPTAKTGQGALAQKIRLLHKKIQAMILRFAPDATPDEGIKILPQYGIPSSGNAIPCYYDQTGDGAVLKSLWDPDATLRMTYQTTVRSYADVTMGDAPDGNPLLRNIDDQGFLRIENVQGKDGVADIKRRIEEIRDSRRLPFDVVEVRLAPHGDEGDLKELCRHAELEYRYQDLRVDLLRRLYQVGLYLRNLEDCKNGWLAYVKHPVGSGKGLLATVEALMALLHARLDRFDLEQFEKTLFAMFRECAMFRAGLTRFVHHSGAQPLFSPGLMAPAGKTAAPYYALLALAVAEIRSQVQTLFEDLDVNPLIALVRRVRHERAQMQKTHPLLFSQFMKDNPGLEHGMGVPMGGTYVLVSEGTRVVADFFLPYLCCGKPCPEFAPVMADHVYPLFLECACQKEIPLIDISLLWSKAAPEIKALRLHYDDGRKTAVLQRRGVPIAIDRRGLRLSIKDVRRDNADATYLVLEPGPEMDDRPVEFQLEAVGRESWRYPVWVLVHPPAILANDDVAVTVPGKPVTIRLLANDLLPNANTSVRLISTPSRGEIVKEKDPSIVIYKPFGKEPGIDQFDYEVSTRCSDGRVVASAARITVHISDCCKEADPEPPPPPEEPEIRLPRLAFCRDDTTRYRVGIHGDVRIPDNAPGIVTEVKILDTSGGFLSGRLSRVGTALRIDAVDTLRPGEPVRPVLGAEDPRTADLRRTLVASPAAALRTGTPALPGGTVPRGSIRIGGNPVPLDRSSFAALDVTNLIRRGTPTEISADVEYFFLPSATTIVPGSNVIEYQVPTAAGALITKKLEVTVYDLPDKFTYKVTLNPAQNTATVEFNYAPSPKAGPYVFQWNFDDGKAPEKIASPKRVFSLTGKSAYNVMLNVWVDGLPGCERRITQLVFLGIVKTKDITETIAVKKPKWTRVIESAEVVTVTDKKDRDDMDAWKEFMTVIEKLVEGQKGEDDLRDGKLDEIVRTNSGRSMNTLATVIKKTAERHTEAEVEPLNDLFRDQAEVLVKFVGAKNQPVTAESEAILNDMGTTMVELAKAGVPINRGDRMAVIFKDAREQTEDEGLKTKLQELEELARRQ